MAVSWSTILKLLPNVAAGLLPGLVSSSVAGMAGRSLGKTMLSGGAFTYPEMSGPFEYPELDFGGTRTNVNGKETVLPAMNGMTMDRSKETLDAILAQSLEQHNKAVQLGNEDKLASWWPGTDNRPRRSFKPKSTAVSDIIINDDNTISIRFRSTKNRDKWYTYKGGSNPREASEAVKDLLTSPSIGRALPRKGKLAWKDSRHLLEKKGTPDRNVGQWGRDHYNPGWFAR